MNKTILIALLVLVVIAVAGGGYYFVLAKKASPHVVQHPKSTDEETPVLTLLPSDVGLVFTKRDDGKAVKFSLNNDNIQSVEYQISYTKKVNDEEVPEGLIGDSTVSSGADKGSIGYRERGTCSANKCTYVNVVSGVKLTLKITKNDGKVYQVEDSLSL